VNDNRRITLLLALLSPIFVWAGLTYPGYFELEHGFRPIFNLADLARRLPAIGWAPAVGQPYDLLRGEGPLAYWLALAPRALGASSATAVKWVFGASLVAGALGMYAWARRTLGEWPGLVAAASYALWPIGLATVYARGALAEATFLGLMPWLLCLVANRSPRGAIALALGLAAAIWIQAGLALWFAAVLLIYVGFALWPMELSLRGAGFVPKQSHPLPEIASAQTTGLAMTGRKALPGLHLLSQFWPVAAGLALGLLGLLPAAFQHGLAGQTYVNFAEHFVHPHQLLLAEGDAGPSVAGPADALTFQLGLIACGLAVLGLALPGVARSEIGHSRSHYAIRNTQYATRFTSHCALAAVLIYALLSTTLAAPLWRLLSPLQGTLTYPWQTLLLVGPWLAWLAGLGGKALLDRLPGDGWEAAVPLVTACLLTLTLLGSFGYLTTAPAAVAVADAPLAIFGDNEIALLDATPVILPPRGATTTTLQAGATISVTVHWQALRPLERDYTVFLHATDPNGQLQGQQDTMPQSNKLPTTRWRPGQIVADQYYATLKPGALSGEGYTVSLGLYQWQTGQRLRAGTDDKVMVKP
jgi:hypothetical protein